MSRAPSGLWPARGIADEPTAAVAEGGENVEEAQRLLEDQQRRAESLRTRGGQVAGFGAAVLALIGGNANA